ncbi:sulfatase family protein [Persicirhabdus sediminis]|uniref:Sulfatase-like hydrolase/transferase n=1 Tax=Persicirhabdus sediminis TaxID=454144 RepID=A0A8J7MEY6_9BACT|nr:sulfatase-like hydrolase/transferase [Persicirhabdus sediminis]MBK1792111.1 sulfatase-like hydrolase/transferase [Persicirhabdus sediminis]
MMNLTMKMPVALASMGLSAMLATAASPPNVVVFYVDDMGWGDVGYHGFDDIKTPSIDSLAAGGVHFTQGYTSASVCGPSRSGLLTGVYQQKLGVYGNGAAGVMNAEQPLIFKTLKEHGYTTGAVGKWGIHVGSETPMPTDNGVDFFYGFLGGGHDYYHSSLDANHAKPGWRPIYRNAEMEPPIQEKNGYLTELFTEESLGFLDRHAGDEKPFFLYVAYNAVHSPWTVPQPYLDRVDDLEVHHPDRKVLAGMALCMDDGVGQIVDKLKEKNVYDNTIIFFMSDNGTPAGQGVKKPYTRTERNDTVMSSPGPFNGYKGDTYEGGIRIPYIIHFPKELPQGKVYEYPVINLDMAATVTARIGVDSPGEGAPFGYDGKDLFPYLKGEKTERPHEVLYWRRGNDYAIRVGDMKLAFNDQRGPQTIRLFDMVKDKEERIDLDLKMPELAQSLQDRFDAWDSELAPANRPQANRNFDYAKGQRTDVKAFNAAALANPKKAEKKGGKRKSKK